MISAKDGGLMNDLNHDAAAGPPSFSGRSPRRDKIAPDSGSGYASTTSVLDQASALDRSESSRALSSLKRRCSTLQRHLDSVKSQLGQRERDHRTEVRALTEEMRALKTMHEAEKSRLADERNALRRKLHGKKRIIVEQNGRLRKVRGYIVEVTDELERLVKENDERRCGRCRRRMASQKVDPTSPPPSDPPATAEEGTSVQTRRRSRVSDMEEKVLQLTLNQSFEGSENSAASAAGAQDKRGVEADRAVLTSTPLTSPSSDPGGSGRGSDGAISNDSAFCLPVCLRTADENQKSDGDDDDGIDEAPEIRQHEYELDPTLGVYERARVIHRRTTEENRWSVSRRTSLDVSECRSDPGFGRLVLAERFRDWASSLLRLDPRHQILTYFDDVARDGCTLMTAGIGGRARRRGSHGSVSLADSGGILGDSRMDLCAMFEQSDFGDSGLSFFAEEAARNLAGGGGTNDAAPQQRKSSLNSARGSITSRRAERRRSSAVLHPELQSPLLRLFDRSSVFTVWRPCSLDAIRAMMAGDATGKGLDVKGKSAKMGRLSGYVPFVQIHEEEHKREVTRIPRGARVRAFYGSRTARDQVVDHLRRSANVDDDDELDNSMGLDPLDDYARTERPCWGFECPLPLFWDTCVAARTIERPAGSDLDTNRPSEPAFQDMNLETIKKGAAAAASPAVEEIGAGVKRKGVTIARAVVYQSSSAGDGDDPLDPRTLLMAYEEKGRVLPVVSDLDCFIAGTRGVRYDQTLPAEQVELVKWCVSSVESILEEQQRRAAATANAGETGGGAGDEVSWSRAWLEVLKRDALGETTNKKPDVPVPPFGFGDPTSYKIMEHAVDRLKCGAVRHGAECFNYAFPQDVDDEFLVVSNTLPGAVSWKYVSESELRELLCRKIDAGFAFPINPKWVLCDPGWKRVYDRLMSSDDENVCNAMDVWFPPSSGVRESIEDVCARHPEGFQTVPSGGEDEEEEEQSLAGGMRPSSLRTLSIDRTGSSRRWDESTEAMDLAELELRKYLKRKLRAAVMMRTLNTGNQRVCDNSGSTRMEDDTNDNGAL